MYGMITQIKFEKRTGGGLVCACNRKNLSEMSELRVGAMQNKNVQYIRLNTSSYRVTWGRRKDSARSRLRCEGKSKWIPISSTAWSTRVQTRAPPPPPSKKKKHVALKRQEPSETFWGESDAPVLASWGVVRGHGGDMNGSGVNLLNMSPKKKEKNNNDDIPCIVNSLEAQETTSRRVLSRMMGMRRDAEGLRSENAHVSA
jgi:hypothetical protein